MDEEETTGADLRHYGHKGGWGRLLTGGVWVSFERSSQSYERRKYRNPPIIEAICSFAFKPGVPWNITIPGLLYESLRDEYPDLPELRGQVEANFDPEAPEGANLTVRQPLKVAYTNGNRVVIVGENVLTVHCLAPYEGWEDLRSRALRTLDHYRSVAKPESIAQVGLRYVNRVAIPENAFNFADYFTVAQGLPSQGFPGAITSFFDRMEYRYFDSPAKITFTWASQETESGEGVAFILDFDLIHPGPVDFENVANLLDDLRRREAAAFESIIGDKLREAFDAEH
ncbi:TIGR04255 family protein [Streptomyces sp. NPDC004830]